MKSTNLLERLNEEIKRRTPVARIFLNPASCSGLVPAPCAETHVKWLTGDLVFAATLLGQGVNTENDSGIWLRTLSRNGFVLNNLVREGNPPDSTRPDILWRSFGEPVLNWAGQVAFSGSLRGPGIGQANDTGLWVTTLRSVVQVTQEDQQAFGTAAGVLWSGFGEPALNVRVMWHLPGRCAGEGVGGANDSGLWVITPDSFPLLDPSGVLTNRILVAREGDLAADGAGAKWNSFGEPVLNSSGQLALSATLTGAGVSEYSDSGVWLGAPHQLRLVARENNAAPGVNSGTRWAGFGEPVVNDSGQIAFRGVIRGSGVTTGVNDEGIWVGHANAPETLRLVASTDIARNNWEQFAIGAAISGITLVCGENVCGVDPELVLGTDNKVQKSPEMDRRINTYRRFHEGFGEILVQMNVEDTRLGVAEYVSSKHNLDTIELKWGQGAKCIGGEIKVNTLERSPGTPTPRLCGSARSCQS